MPDSPADYSALGTATSAGLPEGRRAGDDRLVSVLQTPLCRLLGVLIPAVASRSASSQRQSAGPQRTILEPWCSAIHPTRPRTPFCYALMVLSTYPSQHQLPREGETWKVGMTLGTSSAVLQAPGGTTGTASLLRRSANWAALVTA
jgi:hypothetical protein